ncbi:helix-turn-helix domain-containing protein [Amorphus sp. 3PC139-8]|uniref:helix-turn-helix domain-containing protein n=1 Tax=Amorphus sp. 3PC139-8 TaxID=2735676 RepID=UPI00345DE43A
MTAQAMTSPATQPPKRHHTLADAPPRAATTLDAYIGTMIRSRRIELGISQQDLATRIGVTFQQIQKYERGLNRVAANRLPALSDVLEVSYTFFFPDDLAAADHPAVLSDVSLKIARLTKDLSPDDQRTVYNLVKDVAARLCPTNGAVPHVPAGNTCGATGQVADETY